MIKSIERYTRSELCLILCLKGISNWLDGALRENFTSSELESFSEVKRLNRKSKLLLALNEDFSIFLQKCSKYQKFLSVVTQ